MITMENSIKNPVKTTCASYLVVSLILQGHGQKESKMLLEGVILTPAKVNVYLAALSL